MSDGPQDVQSPPQVDPQHPLLADLTAPQRQAVTTTEGPLLVVAAAGSGKTRVITRRVAWLVKETGIAPWQILAITFTNKAAGEMRERVGTLVTERQARALTVSTFHALCARLMREFADRAGIKPDFTIYDADDQKRAIKQAMKELDINKQNFTPDALKSAISNAKNELIDHETYAGQSADFFQRICTKVYTRYQQILKTNNALDFDDLLMETAFLLRRDSETRQTLQERFQYLLIDEYQDTNHAQFVIANHIGSAHGNICVVGDPDQSIYGWRGANIRNILEFEQHYPQAKVVALGQNYRSTPQILKAADTLIRNNRQRRHKPLFTENPDGDRIKVIQHTDEEAEASWVVDWFRDQHEAGVPWSNMVVFYRMNMLSRVMEDACMRAGIPYQIARGTAFYDRAEVRDAIGYLRLLSNPDDGIALGRVINQPTRGIGKTTIEHLEAYAAANGITFWQACEKASLVPALTPRAQSAVLKFVNMIDGWRKKLTDEHEMLTYVPGVRDLTEMVIRDSGLEAHYRKIDPEEEKVGNLYELVSAAQRFDDEYGEEGATLGQRLFDYLESVALVSDVDAVQSDAGAVTLMTLHAAKGLEFPVVAMIGLEEGLLPHSRSMDTPAEMEEERRLCFVGITRAEQKLAMNYAKYRTVRGMRDRTIRSHFLDELPPDVLEPLDMSGFAAPWDEPSDDGEDAFEDFGAYAPKRGRSGRGRSTGGASLGEGDLVRHPQFGEGKVLSIAGGGPNARAKVHFFNVGVKTLILEYARLEKVR